MKTENEKETVEVSTKEKENTSLEAGGKAKKQKKEKKEKKPVDKAKRKKMIRRTILGVIAALILVVIISNKIAASAPQVIPTVAVTKGEIEQFVNTSGTVQTSQSKTYFSPVTVKIGEVAVEAGDAVKAGDLLLAYDADSLNKETQLAELSLKSDEGSYNNSVQNNNEQLADLREANVNLDVLEQQIEDTERYITNLENKISKKKSELAHFGALLQISLLDWQNQPESDEYMNLQKQVQLNQYEQNNNAEVKGWEDELKVYNEMLSNYKEYRSEMKSQKNTSDHGKMTSGAKEELEANNEKKELEAKDKIENLKQVQDGISADFNGVVTKVSAVEGATVTEGTELFTLESTEDVVVRIEITKYDLEKIKIGQEATVTIAGKKYAGEVSKISRMAEKNQGGAAVVATEIKLLNPDSDVYLGVEAKVSIKTAREENALLVPTMAVNTDMEGSFIYTIEDGLVEKRRVTTGIASETMTQIIEGVKEGDQMITEVTADIIEGMPATALPE